MIDTCSCFHKLVEVESSKLESYNSGFDVQNSKVKFFLLIGEIYKGMIGGQYPRLCSSR